MWERTRLCADAPKMELASELVLPMLLLRNNLPVAEARPADVIGMAGVLGGGFGVSVAEPRGLAVAADAELESLANLKVTVEPWRLITQLLLLPLCELFDFSEALLDPR